METWWLAQPTANGGTSGAGRTPDHRPGGGGQSRWNQGADDHEEDQEEPCILALGVSGSVLQAIVEEVTKLKMKVVIRAVSSVPPQNLPGDAAAEAVIAADCAWGTRMVTRAATLSWISPWYQPLSTRRTTPRRLLLGEFRGQRGWNPHRQPVLAIDAGDITNQVGLLVSPEAADRCRDVIERIRTQAGDRTVLSTRERLFQAEHTALGQNTVAPDVVQFTVGCARALTADELRTHILANLPAQLRRPGEVLWWTSTREADYVFAPTMARAVPAVIAELKKAITEGFPSMRVCATTHGIAIGGVHPTLVPGLLSVAGLASATHGLTSVKSGPMHYPFRIAKQGMVEIGSSIEGWKISCAEVDNDPLYIVRDTTFTGTQIRAAIAATLGHPCTPSLAAIVELGDSAPIPVWLVRLPAVARPEADRWQAAGGHLRIAGCSTQAQPAPPTQALDEGGARRGTKDEDAAELQRAWNLEVAPQHAPVYFGTRKQAATDRTQEDVRRMREAAWTEENTPGTTKVWHAIMPGVRTQLKLWDTPIRGSIGGIPNAQLDPFLGTCATAKELLENTVHRVPIEPTRRHGPLRLELLTGDFILAVVQAGTEIQIDTATHSGRSFLTSNKWILVGLSRTERSRIATLGVSEDWSIAIYGPTPLALWFGSDERRETQGGGGLQRNEGIAPSIPPSTQNADAHAHVDSGGARAANGSPCSTGCPPVRTDQDRTGDNGGPQWTAPITIEAWLAKQLQGEPDEMQEGLEDRTSEDMNTAVEVLEMFCPSPARRKAAKLVDWLRQHTTILCGEPNKKPKRWMWEFVLYLWALEEAGIAELRSTDPATQEDLLSQMRLPVWARRALPITQWTQGQRAMTPGRAYLGMNIGTEERPRSLIAAVPAQRPYTIDNLNRLAEQAEWRPDEGVDISMGVRGQGGRRRDVPWNVREQSSGREGKGQRRERSRSPVGGPPSNDRPEKGSRNCPPTDTGCEYPTITHQRYGADAVTEITGIQQGTANHMLPRKGRGVVNMQATDGTLVRYACAVSSIIQLLIKEYGVVVSSEETADLAIMVRKWERTQPDTVIEISDAWWYILPRYLPRGPWPELLVLRLEGGLLNPDHTLRVTIPGPADMKTLVAIGDGGHFDPVWWPTSRGFSAARPIGAPRLPHIAKTVTPNFGPGVGIFAMLQVEYGGKIGFSPVEAGDGCTEQDSRVAIFDDRAWQPWVQRFRREGINPGDVSTLAIVILACAHPMPPYPVFGSLPRALRMLAPNARLVAAQQGDAPTGIMLLAFEEDGCHIGRLLQGNTQEALTRLQDIWAPAVAVGHQGP